jgi:sugar O-acyltransferase (sialic acid O-acetyltransferase NeuD family)
MKPLVIFGAGGQAREVAQIVADLNQLHGNPWRLIGFLVDPGQAARVPRPLPAPVLGGTEWLLEHPEVQVVVAVGAPAGRRSVVQRLCAQQPAVRFATLVHPRAWLASSAALGEGSVVFAGVLVNANATIGKHANLNLAATISHDCEVGHFVSLGPGAHLAGGVTLGEGTDIGVGACLRPGVRVGANSVVGAGAAVVFDLPAQCTAFGVPARVQARSNGRE